MDRKTYNKLVVLLAMIPILFVTAQKRQENPAPMNLDVGNINMNMNRTMGDGGMASQFSWDLTGDNKEQTEIFYWPRDQYKSNMLYQIFNPVVLDDNGIIDEFGKNHAVASRGTKMVNNGENDWAIETRRYRPCHISVDGIQIDQAYKWNVDPKLKTDIKLEFEDVSAQYGLREHVEIYASSNPYHANYFIWKATHKFTGEIKIPRKASVPTDTLPDQTINFWLPTSFSFGPSKLGELQAHGSYSFEGEDDLDSWFARKTTPFPGNGRDTLKVAYYWDAFNPGTKAYKNGSNDDTGDPDRNTGFLCSPQIPGFALLYAPKSQADATDDVRQPYSMPHAGILSDLWGRSDLAVKLTYRGDDARGRFPLDPITQKFATVPEKGPMRFICPGPYSLTKNKAQGRQDSITFVYAVGVGGICFDSARAIGARWLSGAINDSAKKAAVLLGRDSLWQAMDRANWAWHQISSGSSIPSAPPSPDIRVRSGAGYIGVEWEYPAPSYFKNSVTGADDFYAWRVYRKRGTLLVSDPLDQNSMAKWEQIYETRDRNKTSYADSSVDRGVDYYYAVTAVNDGTQNDDPMNLHKKLESSRYANMSGVPAASFKPGLNVSNLVRVSPNPYTKAQGAPLASGTPNRISFYNLPYNCSLKIFTETGDLVKSLDHSGNADQSWNQQTDSNQLVASGIYILAVTNCSDVSGRKLDNQFVKFIIIR